MKKLLLTTAIALSLAGGAFAQEVPETVVVSEIPGMPGIDPVTTPRHVVTNTSGPQVNEAYKAPDGTWYTRNVTAGSDWLAKPNTDDGDYDHWTSAGYQFDHVITPGTPATDQLDISAYTVEGADNKFATKEDLSSVQGTPGEDGDKGERGEKGDKGDTGAAGADGTRTQYSYSSPGEGSTGPSGVHVYTDYGSGNGSDLTVYDDGYINSNWHTADTEFPEQQFSVDLVTEDELETEIDNVNDRIDDNSDRITDNRRFSNEVHDWALERDKALLNGEIPDDWDLSTEEPGLVEDINTVSEAGGLTGVIDTNKNQDTKISNNTTAVNKHEGDINYLDIQVKKHEGDVNWLNKNKASNESVEAGDLATLKTLREELQEELDMLRKDRKKRERKEAKKALDYANSLEGQWALNTVLNKKSTPVEIAIALDKQQAVVIKGNVRTQTEIDSRQDNNLTDFKQSQSDKWTDQGLRDDAQDAKILKNSMDIAANADAIAKLTLRVEANEEDIAYIMEKLWPSKKDNKDRIQERMDEGLNALIKAAKLDPDNPTYFKTVFKDTIVDLRGVEFAKYGRFYLTEEYMEATDQPHRIITAKFL